MWTGGSMDDEEDVAATAWLLAAADEPPPSSLFPLLSASSSSLLLISSQFTLLLWWLLFTLLLGGKVVGHSIWQPEGRSVKHCVFLFVATTWSSLRQSLTWLILCESKTISVCRTKRPHRAARNLDLRRRTAELSSRTSRGHKDGWKRQQRQRLHTVLARILSSSERYERMSTTRILGKNAQVALLLWWWWLLLLLLLLFVPVVVVVLGMVGPAAILARRSGLARRLTFAHVTVTCSRDVTVT